MLLNAATEIEHQKPLGAALYERTEQSTRHASGYKGKTRPSLAGAFLFFSVCGRSSSNRTELLCQLLEIGVTRV